MRFGMIVIALMMSICAWGSTASARPPTIMNSPGYDARLAESRKARADYEAAQQQRQQWLATHARRRHTHHVAPLVSPTSR